MEIMHSKLVKLQTVLMLLALLFTVLLPSSVHAVDDAPAAQAVTEYEPISDPNTFNAWAKVQANNTSTTGRIWADKTVDTKPITFTEGELAGQKMPMTKGADFQVALSAISSMSSTSSVSSVPLDIVLVLDVSGSMNENFGNVTKIAALKSAVNNFMAEAAAKNKEITVADNKIKISIVKFAGNVNKKTGNSNDYYGSNSSQIVKDLTVCDDDNLSSLQAAVNSLYPNGPTQADYGMSRAKAALDNSAARSNAKRVIIFFTDGEPTTYSQYSASVAGSAVDTARELKSSPTNPTTIYSIGVFSGADTGDTTKNVNKFMHAISSNYPNAQSTKPTHRDNSGIKLNSGNTASGYYKTAANAADLNTVFSDIFKAESGELVGPTAVTTGDPSTDGYVTFTDRLGEFMEVKGFDAVAYANEIYTVSEVKPDPNNSLVEHYTFTQELKSTGSPAYPKTEAKLSDIVITVTKSDESKTGDLVEVKIPASLLPLRTYNLKTVNGKTTLEIPKTYPINIAYSVGLKEGVREDILNGTSNDPDLAAYVKENAAEDGTVDFYSNYYDFKNPGTSSSNGHPIGNTTATFAPAESNNFYYHVTDTPLYTKQDKNSPATEIKPGEPYYYAIDYYYLDENKVTHSGTNYIGISIATLEEIKSVIKTIDGKCYIEAGTSKGSLPSKIDEQLGDKTITGTDDGNLTGTAQRRIDFKWGDGYNMGVLYLGNNGKLSFDAKGSLRIKKVVSHEEGCSPDPSTTFKMKFELTAQEGASLSAGEAYKYTVTNAAGKQTGGGTIKNGATLQLKDGETAEIEGLPVSCTYKVTEVDLPMGYTSKIDNGEGKIVAGMVKDTAPLVTVTNTYKPESVTLDGKTYLAAAKTLTGRSWLASDTFTFHLETTDLNAPMPADAQVSADKQTRYVERTLQDSEGFSAGTARLFDFGNIQYSKPGTYIYNINEIIPSDSILGISYDNTNYQVTVTVTDDQHGVLKVTSSMQRTSDNATAKVAAFTNTFAAKDEDFSLEAIKDYVYVSDTNTRLTQKNGQFNFKLEASNVNEEKHPLTDSATPPMPDSATAASNDSGRVSFKIHYDDSRDTGKTYYYQLSEVNDKQANVEYSTERYLIKVELSVVDDNGTATLKATPTYFKWDDDAQKWVKLDKQPTESGMTFTNKFTGTTTATLGVSKIISGRDWRDSDEFKFKLETPDSSPMPDGTAEITVRKQDNATPPYTADFASIEYKKAGTYYYTITEIGEDGSGMTLQKTPVNVTVNVTLNEETNQLEASMQYSPTENGKAKFVNTYKAESCEVDASALFHVSKELLGRQWNGTTDTFYFTLSREGNAPLPPVTNVAVNSKNTTANFGKDKLVFSKADQYVYYITEDRGTISGITYDTTKYKIVVDVTDEDGQLKATTTYYKGTLKDGEYKFDKMQDGDTTAAFTNTYAAKSVTLNGEDNLSVTKKLVGREWGKEEAFTFEIAVAGGSAENTPLPKSTTLKLTNPNLDEDTATGSFGDITYTKAGNYSYTIREVHGDDETAAITQWDGSEYTVTVDVKDDGTGELKVNSCSVKKSGDEGNSNSITFTNTYEASSTPTKDVTVNDAKTSADNQPVKVGDKLTYSIHWVNDSIENGKFVPATVTITDQVPENTQLVTTPDNAIYDDTTRTLTWTLNAAANTSGDVSFTVSVLPSASAALDPITNQAKVKIGDHESETNLVTNPTPYNPDSHKKVLDDNGKDIDNTLVSPGQVLTYQITWVAPLAAEGAETVDVVIKDTVPANTTFVPDSATDNIAPDENGLLTWNIQGQKPGASGTVSFQVKVNDAVGDNGDITNQAFVNNKATVEATHNYLPGKTADKDANTTLKVGDELTYTIKYKNLEDAPADITVTDKVPTGTEFVSAENGTCENGTVTWNLTGVEPGAKGTVRFTVRVTMDAVGKSIENQAEVKIGDRAPVTTTKTENKNIEQPSPAVVTLTAHKTLVSDVGNHTLAAHEFAFTLLDKDGKLVQTTTNDAEGNVTFGTLELDHVGEYTYTICEVVDGDLGYITYDNSRYTVTFNVDAKNGKLAATEPVYSLNGKTFTTAEFINHYTAELPADASFSLSATKTLTGRSMINGEFFFTLEDEGGHIVATASSDAEGNIQFPAVGLKNVQAAYTALLAAAEPVQPAAEPTPAEDEQPVKIENGEQAPLETAVAANSLEDTPAVVTDAEPETEPETKPETKPDVAPETDPETKPETKPETEPAPTVDTDAVQALLTRWYTIREYAQGKDGVTYDANTYMVRVPLVDKDGTGTLTVDKDNIQFFAADGETLLDNNAVVFNNSYAAEGVDLTVTAQKQLTGRSMADGEFSFRLSCNDDPANEQTVTSDANGRIAFALHYDDKDGTGTQETHTYTVTEVRGDNDTITYDDTAYTFTVEVIDDGTGHLTTKVTQPEAMVFRNVYTPKATSITLAGNKVLNGRAQKAGEFTFELCDANGAVIATAANGENGYFAFPALSYDEAGEYTYTVREKDTGVGRVTYDKTVYSVTVQVRDEDGQLKADIILPASGLTFTNTYTPEPAQTPAPTPKPTTSPAPAATAAPTPAPARIPQTADSFPLALLIGLLAVSGGALAVLLTARKRGKK